MSGCEREKIDRASVYERDVTICSFEMAKHDFCIYKKKL